MKGGEPMNKGERIKLLRESKGLTQEELAKRLNTTKQTIFKYEKGVITNIPSDRIESMAKIFETTPEYILCWDQVQKKNDALSDIVIRMRTDPAFFEAVKRLNDMDPDKLSGLLALLK